ncbi:hypothetical protein BDV34DRAFT_220197 [Aspergillus parasiticus]|uniref:Uncharacterized protein n=1 Tax=Aspergillus parasiticus TaxID=5067 RepID=A0A5N6E1F5_ASPPA|nr:hypothetical protein BDV34DRAFT_220197 [Aspergillus parasiticus]
MEEGRVPKATATTAATAATTAAATATTATGPAAAAIAAATTAAASTSGAAGLLNVWPLWPHCPGCLWHLVCHLLPKSKQTYPMGEYTPNTIEVFERVYRLTRPPPRHKWWRVLLENFCCCFLTPTKTNIQALLMEEGRFPPDPVPPAPPAPPGPPAAPVPLVAPAGQTTGGTGAPAGKKGLKAWVLARFRKAKTP